MRKFVLQSIPYISIALCYALIGEYFLYKNKESFSIDTITNIQSSSNRELYYGREILGNSISNYKFHMFKKVQPKILVLGQSVMLQFRDFMFEPYEDDFYNTGLMARNCKDLNYVMDLIDLGEMKKPELIVLGVDISFVTKHTFLDRREWVRDYPEDRATSSKSHLKGYQRIFFNPDFREIPETDAGFGRAGMRGRGYRNDGSYRHRPEIYEYLKDSVYFDGELINYLKNRTAPFIEPFEFDSAKAELLMNTLDRMNNLGLELLLYVPPYSDVYFQEAMKDEMFHRFWTEFMRFQDELIANNFNVIPFSTTAQLGLPDDYMVDAEHPSEVLSALQLMDYVKSGRAKGELINSLNFSNVNELINSERTVPISFLIDSLDNQLIELIKEGNY